MDLIRFPLPTINYQSMFFCAGYVPLSGMQITFLGTGTSQGIPVVACECKVCTSADPKDKRLRSSIMIEDAQTTVVIDTGPDFRQQMLRENVTKLNAVVFTHAHKDHIAGLDDIRAFNFKQHKDMDIYATLDVQKALKREFYYVFEKVKYPGVPAVQLHTISNSSFRVGSFTFQPIDVLHYKLPVKAFRLGDFTYITDAKIIPPEELEKIKGSKVLVINALRREPHISHFNLEEALDMIDRIGPERAYLIHLSHLMGTTESLESILPQGVFASYDGLKIKV
jgi:phosphoribosyl 1,2-cyclic phosphate phosphodiesterase